MLAYEKELQKDYVTVKQGVIAAGQQVAQVGRQVTKEAKSEWYKIDKYYSSVAQMLADEAPFAGGSVFLFP